MANNQKWFNTNIANKFKEAWSNIDINATGHIKDNKLAELLLTLE